MARSGKKQAAIGLNSEFFLTVVSPSRPAQIDPAALHCLGTILAGSWMRLVALESDLGHRMLPFTVQLIPLFHTDAWLKTPLAVPQRGQFGGRGKDAGL